MELAIAIDEFLKVRRLGNYSLHTLSNYGRDLRQFREHLLGLIGREPELAEITRDLILSHLAECARRLGRVSMDRHRYAFKAFFEWVEDAALGSSPMRGITFPRHSYQKLPRFISPEQIAAIIAAESPFKKRRNHRARELRDVAMIEVLFGSAIRISEAISLDWRDWRLQAPGELFIRSGKGGDDRIALIGEPAIDALEAWSGLAWVKDLDGPIFQNVRGERLTVRSAELMVQSRARRAGNEEAVSPHWLRHSAATAMMQAGAGIADIGALLGHKNLNTTSKYTHTDIGYLKKQMAYHPRDAVRQEVNSNARAEAVRPTEREEKAMEHSLKWTTENWKQAMADPQKYWKNAPTFDRLARFVNDREAMLRDNDPISFADDQPDSLRFLAECSSAESKELLTLASRYEAVLRELTRLKADEHAVLARISFAGASLREVREARRALKASTRKLAA